MADEKISTIGRRVNCVGKNQRVAALSKLFRIGTCEVKMVVLMPDRAFALFDIGLLVPLYCWNQYVLSTEQKREFA